MINEIDKVGSETLEIISEADHFNKWIFETIRKYCFDEILEIGSGLGNISFFFISSKLNLTLSDLREEYCIVLSNHFESNQIINLDIVHPNFENVYKSYLDFFDSVVILNVVEHIVEDSLAISNCKKLLKDKGNLIVLVPSYEFLYNSFDKELGHIRRYTLKRMSNLLVKNNFNIIHSQYFNFIGIFGWFISGKIQRNKVIPKNQMGLFNKLVFLFKIIDKIVFNRIGLSCIVVGKNIK